MKEYQRMILNKLEELKTKKLMLYPRCRGKYFNKPKEENINVKTKEDNCLIIIDDIFNK